MLFFSLSLLSHSHELQGLTVFREVTARTWCDIIVQAAGISHAEDESVEDCRTCDNYATMGVYTSYRVPLVRLLLTHGQLRGRDILNFLARRVSLPFSCTFFSAQ